MAMGGRMRPPNQMIMSLRGGPAGLAVPLAPLAVLLLHSAGLVAASLPPIVCDENGQYCTLVNAYRAWPDRKLCEVGRVYYPRTEKELVAIVAQAVRSGSKIKAVSKWAHS